MKITLKNIAFLGFLIFGLYNSCNLRASHIFAGEIRVEILDCKEYKVRVIVIGYQNQLSGASFGGGDLILGDGFQFSPRNEDFTTEPINNIYERVSYTFEHTFPGPGQYLISYTEYNRTGGIVNLRNSANKPLHIESRIILTEDYCYGTPVLKTDPFDEACIGLPFEHNPAAIVNTTDSTVVDIIEPKSFRDRDIGGYSSPVAFSPTNMMGTGPGEFYINEEGTLIWDTPFSQGQYSFALRISNFAFINGEWQRVSYLTRDMSVNVKFCTLNNPPYLEFEDEICVTAGDTVRQDILGYDPDSDEVLIEVFSEFDVLPEGLIFKDTSEWKLTIHPETPAKSELYWETSCTDIREKAYSFVYKITDRKPGENPLTVSFKLLRIKVIPPEPKIKNVSYNFETNSVALELESFPCSNVYSKAAIWRKSTEDPVPLNRGCETFIVKDALAKVGSISEGQTFFVDKNPPSGATVCYYIIYSESGKEDAFSDPDCIGPIEIDAPVPLIVSVEQTSKTEGVIDLEWMPPIEINTELFGDDFTYLLHRRINDEESGFQIIAETKGTKFEDQGLNTLDNFYDYFISFRSGNGPSVSPETIIDSSATASQIGLNVEPNINSVNLSWQASVPWANGTLDFPYAYIYRGTEPENLILHDSVDINSGAFRYVDNKDLRKGIRYFYKVMMRGTYQNELIREPLNNYSQIASGFLVDDTPPAIGVLSTTFDCNNLNICEVEKWEIVLNWTPAENEEDDFSEILYNIYFRNNEGQDILLATTYETSFVHIREMDTRGCYYLSAMDLNGNESSFSNLVCTDNCPYFKLPNVLTISTVDNCNDRISFEKNNHCGDDPDLCIRNVIDMRFSVFNRWGKKIITKEFYGEDLSLIWDGTDRNGQKVTSGIYYYVAEVTFIVNNEGNRNQIYKGNITVF